VSYFGAALFWQQTRQLMRAAQDNIYVARVWKQLSLTGMSKPVTTSNIAISADRSLLSHDRFILLSYCVRLVQIIFSVALAVCFCMSEATKKYFQREIEVHTAVTMKINLLWDTTSCSLV
jgi:intracellular septation protein A